MTRILYAVNGEGMGHAIRSKVIIDYLIKKKHELIIVAGGRAFDFLSRHFKNVYNIDCYNIVYKDNSVQNIETTVAFVKKFPKALVRNLKQIMKIVIKFEPEIVITDFEPFSSIISKMLFKIPVVAIDNISIITKGKIHIPIAEIPSYITAKFISKPATRIDADRYIIPSFFNAELKTPNDTVLVPPVLRPEILKAKTKRGNHIVVYQTSATNNKLLSSLKKMRENFIIYGFDKDKNNKNLTFRRFSEKKFIADLASCKAVIVNGGFNVISEAIYLQKPILSVPVRKQFEQIMNASYVERLGYGEYHKFINSEKIANFLRRLPEYENNIKSYKQDGNKLLFREVDRAVKALAQK